MATVKADFTIVPIRAALPVGAVFKFDGLRTKYEIVAAPDFCFACKYCALRRASKRVYCSSLFCTPGKRADGQFVYVRVYRAQEGENCQTKK